MSERASLVKSTDYKDSIVENPKEIITSGGAMVITRPATNIKTPTPQILVKQKIKIIRKKELIAFPIKVKSKIIYHLIPQENQSSFSMQGISLKNAVQNTRENTAKMLLFSSTVQLENRLLQIKKIERTFSFVRYQYSKTYTTRPPPFGRV